MGRVDNNSNIIKINSEKEQNTAVEKAGHVLLSGGIVAFPTESFYGLAVDINNDNAIEKLFALKKRDKKNPILILLPDADALNDYAEEIPEVAIRLMDEFWPGGLTMLFKAEKNISPLLTAYTDKIGIRYSSHPLAAALAKSIGRPVTGTSSNISGHPPCTSASEVLGYFGDTIDLILDNGHTQGGQGSTIIDITVDPCVVLREGIVLKSDIDKVLFK